MAPAPQRLPQLLKAARPDIDYTTFKLTAESVSEYASP